ncbi:hypothetical protein Pyn_31270 [Prunus yedoensis var. nudiflora]|uniref:DUF7610 domain-containing protein n=1 Tax=Prunus yedoensis var. nudiflora TaxID=2094558 RepID=A0A314YDZ9_PRUYE|nr:hypothetical protein Pyn_31270 [Prunus yedoensis var. nudiflora]
MAKGSLILQKKLNEVEAQLNHVLSLPPEDPSTTPCRHQLQCYDMEQRLAFVKTLLCAEMASHPSKPHHLKHMAWRLGELEKIFHDWNSFTLTSAELDQYRVDHDGNGDGGDGRSTCSCTESCLDDDDCKTSADDSVIGSQSERNEEAAEGGSEVEENNKEMPMVVFNNSVFEHDEGEEEMKEKVTKDEERDDVVELMKRSSSNRISEEEVERKRGSSGVGMTCGAMVTGWMLGMVSMGLVMLSSTGFLFPCGGGDHQYGNFLIPT